MWLTVRLLFFISEWSRQLDNPLELPTDFMLVHNTPTTAVVAAALMVRDGKLSVDVLLSSFSCFCRLLKTVAYWLRFVGYFSRVTSKLSYKINQLLSRNYSNHQIFDSRRSESCILLAIDLHIIKFKKKKFATIIYALFTLRCQNSMAFYAYNLFVA